MRHGKRPTRAQKITISKFGLNWENWLIIRASKSYLILLHKHTNRVRKIPASWKIPVIY